MRSRFKFCSTLLLTYLPTFYVLLLPATTASMVLVTGMLALGLGLKDTVFGLILETLAIAFS